MVRTIDPKIGKIEPASQFAEAAEQLQLVKKRTRISWKTLDCQGELHKSLTCNKFATLMLGEEEHEFDEDVRGIGGNCSFASNTAVQRTRAKTKVNTKNNIDILVKVQESPGGGCAKTHLPTLSLHGGECQSQSTAVRATEYLATRRS